MKIIKTKQLLILIFASLTLVVSCQPKGSKSNFIIEFQIPEFINGLSNNNSDPLFVRAMNIAAEQWKIQDSLDFVQLFGAVWDEIAPDENLSRVFESYKLNRMISSNSTNDEVLFIINNIVANMVENSIRVLNNRIDRFNAVLQKINYIGSDRFLYEIIVEDSARLFQLLQANGNFEFWETFDCRHPEDGITLFIIDADKEIKKLADSDSQINDLLFESVDATVTICSETEKNMREYPLLSILQINNDTDFGGSRIFRACVGRAHYSDTAKINEMLALPQILAMKPNNLRFAWTNKPVGTDGVIYELIALKLNPLFGNEAPLTGEVIVDAYIEFNPASGSSYPHISISMNSIGAKIWSQLTKVNINKEIAIVFDGYVYCYPNVHNEITGGNSQISGNFTKQEAKEIVNVLCSGKLPIPVKVIPQ